MNLKTKASKVAVFVAAGTAIVAAVLIWVRPHRSSSQPDIRSGQPSKADAIESPARHSSVARKSRAAEPSFRPAAELEREPESSETNPLQPARNELEFSQIMKLENPAQQRRELDKLFQDWVHRDATGAAGFVLTIEDENERKDSMLRVMQTWGVKDPEAALAWATGAGFDNPYERGVAMSMACTQVSRSDPEGAIRLAFKHSLDRNASGLVEGLAVRWAEMDLPAAREWALSQPATEQRNDLIVSIAQVILAEDPVAATQLILEEIAAGENQEKAILSLVTNLAFQDPETAAAWIASFPQGALRDQASETVSNIRNRQRASEAHLHQTF